ncbi:MAG: V-type ATP synthase subunit E family protein [Sulfolobales archaeon]
MSSIESLREAVLKKAREDAERIVAAAQEEARKILEEARDRKRAIVESERKKVISELSYEAKIAEAKMKARLTVNKARYELVNKATSKAALFLEELKPEYRFLSLKNLLEEAIDVAENSLGKLSKLIAYVSERDLELAREVVEELAVTRRIELELRTAGISGGVIVEDPEGRIRIDNSYNSRIKVFLSRLSKDVIQEVGL